MLKHYIVICNWAKNGDAGISIKGVTHTFRKAKKIFSREAKREKEIANTNWESFVDTEVRLDMGESGDYASEHTYLYIESVRNAKK